MIIIVDQSGSGNFNHSCDIIHLSFYTTIRSGFVYDCNLYYIVFTLLFYFDRRLKMGTQLKKNSSL